MKKVFMACAATILLAIGAWWGLRATHGQWAGVDKTVIEKYAEKADRPPSQPLINTDQGDLLLLMFLLAGTGGGFVGGYYFRDLFPPEREET